MTKLSDEKKMLRQEYRRRRDAFYRQLDPATKGLAFRRPPSPLAKLIEQSEIIALYSAAGSEAPTARLIEYLIESGKIICLPAMTTGSTMQFRQVDTLDLLESGYRDIAEPGIDCPVVKPDLIIAPLVAFDRSLGRLGQGGGHYDRAFENHPQATRVGLAWSIQEADHIPMQAHDFGLHMIVTEAEIIQKVDMTI
ncbi:5-formyltetrahydrofolate cyclo-ligase [Parasphingorhabdus sp. JC815]|uniref:5-formyltetrahydrofolate cyclo-ligase n=1 Tax=Parasphingorhabdus sp. JC815 TaxID=3232140 RepID=UPI003458AE24